MQLDIISYHDLVHSDVHQILEQALLQKGIVGIKDVPGFLEKSQAFVHAAQEFARLPSSIKEQYTPKRDEGQTEGYELGAERFQGEDGQWRVDDKKASYYAYVSEHPRNVWPAEIDLKTPYLELGSKIFQTGKLLLNIMGLNARVGLNHDQLQGYGRMLHYQKETNTNHVNPNWCGAHVDHGVFTGLMPAYYFAEGEPVEEPSEAGLFIRPHLQDAFCKIDARDKSVMLFQVGEFGQLISHDRIWATEHLVKKASSHIERFALAVFYSAADDALIKSRSKLAADARYQNNQTADGQISYKQWETASYERYRAK